jgi:magnesium transporter
MISLYCWVKSQQAGLWLDAEALRTRTDELKAKANVLWIDLEQPTEEEESLLFGQFFPVHPLTLEDITKLRREPGAMPHFPKAEEFSDYLFVVVNPLRPDCELGDGREAPVTDGAEGPRVAAGSGAGGASTSAVGANHRQPTTQLSAVLTENTLLTHHYEPVHSVRELRRFLSKHHNLGERGPDYLFHLILDATVDRYAPLLDHFAESLDAVEVDVLGRATPELLARLLQLKQSILSLRKTLIYEREVLARLARGEFDLIEVRETVYYRNVYDHLVRFSELIESSREMVSDLMQMHLSATSNKLNEIMKVLTMISCAVLPMTLIAGIYGMNFTVLPEKEWTLGYPFALGLMALTGLLAFLGFRWKGWI